MSQTPQGVILPTGNYGVQMGTFCVVHSHDAWVPLEWHHVWPLGDGGPNIAINKIRVCANAHYSIHAVLDHMLAQRKAGQPLEWEFMRHFSPAVRDYARRGFQQIP
jgi:hypothetical protein